MVKVISTKKNKKGSNNSGKRRLCAYALSRINPFLPAAAGLRSPDEFGYPTATAVLRASTTLQTSSGGIAAIAFSPASQQFYYVPANTTGGTVTWSGGSGSSFPQQSSLANLASVYRVVCGGIRVTCEQALTAASGHLWITSMPLDFSISFPYLNWPTTEAQFTQVPLSEKFSLVELTEQPVIAPFRAFDDGIYRFRDSATTNYAASAEFLESTMGWSSLLLYVTGAAASATVLSIEVVLHIEYLQQGSSAYGFIDTVPGLYNESAMAEASAVSTAAPVGVMESAVNSLAAAENFVSRTVNLAGRVIGLTNTAATAAGALASVLGRGRAQYNSAVPAIKYK